MQFRRLLPALLVPLLCLGTSVIRLSLEQTVAQAEWIVEGDVVRNWCAWDDAHRFIWTHTEIAVRNRWKGAAASTITVSEPGGTVNGIAMDVGGMVRYSPGEHVVLFLYRTPIGLIRTVGLAQGKLRVDRAQRVHALAPDLMLVQPAGAIVTGHSISELESTPLSTARERVLAVQEKHR